MTTTIGTPVKSVGTFIRSAGPKAPKSRAAKAAAAPKVARPAKAPKAAKSNPSSAELAMGAPAPKAARTPRAPKVKKERPLFLSAPLAECKGELVACRAGTFVAWLCDKLTRAHGLTRKDFLAEQAERKITQAPNRWIMVNFAERHGYGIQEVERDRFVAVLPKGTTVPKHTTPEVKEAKAPKAAKTATA